MRILILALVMIATWLLWSGFFKPLLLGLGALSCLLTIYIIRRMGYFDNETFAFHYDLRLLGFWAWLGREVLTSSLEVARIVLGRKITVEPKVVDIDASDLKLVDQALLGNSITLTPGTLTLDVYEGRLLVHALTPAGAAALEEGEMQRRVAALGNR
ncbi:MAG: Na+/H+ antiporter subunit E [Gammaproteobacteria bacterium]|nr:Na+/H+ antiporter subunit E [Gammaproteobacteria bacterium]